MINDNYVPLNQLGNGVTTAFSAAWNMLAASYARVYFEDTTTGVQTQQTTGWSIALSDAGWTVTFTTAPASTVRVIIGRVVALEQQTPFRTSRGWQGNTVENAFDKVVGMVQDIGEQADRAVVFPLGDTSSPVLPSATLRANKTFIFDSSGNASAGSVSTAPISVTMEPVVNAASLPLARGLLSAAASGANTDITSLSGITSINGAAIGDTRGLENGDFAVWQATTSLALATTVGYGADRWVALMPASAAGIFARDTSVPTTEGFTYSAKVGRTAASSLTNQISLANVMTSEESIPLAGKTVTLSFWAKAGANYSSTSSLLSVLLPTGTGTDESAANGVAGTWTGYVNTALSASTVTLTTSWQRFSVTTSAVLPAGAKQLLARFAYTPTGTAGADDNFYITGVQLDVGGVATAFRFIPFAESLARAERHYQKSFVYGTTPVQNAGINSGEFQFNSTRAGAASQFGYPRFTTRMRAAPVVTLYSPGAASAEVWDVGATAACTATSASVIFDTGFRVNTTGNGATAVGNPLGIHYVASARL